MNRADKAIIMAAGTGTRMRPVTETIPKPLIRVNGIRLIDTVIQGLQANGIRDISIVTGYLKEQFSVLSQEYEGIRFIENPWYSTCNNISSLYAAREYLGNCIILDGDQMINHSEILNPCFEQSGYCSAYTQEFTEEWLQTVENGIVTGCSRTGGSRGWQLYGISFWSMEDGRRLKEHLETEFEKKKNRAIYWDDIPMFCYPSEYRLGIRPIKKTDVVEIDSYEELLALDASYAGWKEKR